MENRAAKRLALIVGAVAVVGVGAYLMLSAFNENLVFFYSPMQVQAQEAPKGRTFRMGGMVMPGSVKRLEDGVTVSFGITDTGAVIPAWTRPMPPCVRLTIKMPKRVCRWRTPSSNSINKLLG